MKCKPTIPKNNSVVNRAGYILKAAVKLPCKSSINPL